MIANYFTHLHSYIMKDRYVMIISFSVMSMENAVNKCGTRPKGEKGEKDGHFLS